MESIEIHAPRRFLSSRAYRAMYKRYRVDKEVVLLQLPREEGMGPVRFVRLPRGRPVRVRFED